MRVVVAVLLAAQVVSAQPARDVTREFQAGVDAFRLGKYDEARKHLERAKQLDPRLPGPNRFLAAVASAQGRFADCVASARLAIELNPASLEIADTRKLHDDCRRSDGRPSYTQELGDKAAIGVTANVTGATVKISGLVYGATPLEPRPIPAGAHELELTKAGYLPAKLRVNALAGIVTDVEGELAVDPAAGGTAEVGTKVVPRGKGSLLVEPGEEVTFTEVRIDGVAVETTDLASKRLQLEVPVGTHVIEVRTLRNDPWRRRVVIAAERVTRLQPTFIDTTARERVRTKGLWLTGTGIGLVAVGAVTLGIGIGRDEGENRQAFLGLGGGAVGLGAIVLGFGVASLVAGRRPDPTDAPPLALIPVEGGVIAGTGLDF